MAYYYQLLACPKCNRTFEARMFSLTSLIGPPLIHCSTCDTKIDTGRLEWPQMAVRTKCFFLAMTAGYVLAVGLLAGNCFDNAYQLWLGIADAQQLRFTAPTFQFAAAAGGLTVVFIQLLRLVASVWRDGSHSVMSTRDFLFGIQFNLQAKILILLGLMCLVAWLKSLW